MLVFNSGRHLIVHQFAAALPRLGSFGPGQLAAPCPGLVLLIERGSVTPGGWDLDSSS